MKWKSQLKINSSMLYYFILWTATSTWSTKYETSEGKSIYHPAQSPPQIREWGRCPVTNCATISVFVTVAEVPTTGLNSLETIFVSQFQLRGMRVMTLWTSGSVLHLRTRGITTWSRLVPNIWPSSSQNIVVGIWQRRGVSSLISQIHSGLLMPDILS